MPHLAARPIHLGADLRASAERDFDGMSWFAAYAARREAQGDDGWLVMQHEFNESWSDWEIHPAGSEVVLCIKGRLVLLQQYDDEAPIKIALQAGEYAINPPGVWHTADIEMGVEATCLFITAGKGTRHKAR